MRYGSVCSGIEAATVAWHPLGWEAAFFSEIEQFPRAVLEHHYDVPVHGDFTTIGADEYGAIDLLVGGTPCQSFSVAGLRKGMDDERGNLALEFLRLAKRKRPTWLVWENVPGVLSSNKGRDFGAFLGGLAELGYGWAYRILDASGFGVPASRRRVFVIGYMGDWRPPSAVLFERECLQGNSAKNGERKLFPCLYASMGDKWGSNQWVRSGFCISENGRLRRLTPIECERLLGFPDGYTAIPQGRQAKAQPKDPLWDNGNGIQRDAGEAKQSLRSLRRADGSPCCGSLPPDRKGQGDSVPPMQHKAAGGRGYGLGDDGVGISGGGEVVFPDGPRYKALGNSMAVPVMRWIGERIDMVGAVLDSVCPDCKDTGHVCCGGKAGYFECCQSAVQCGCKAVGE